MIEWSKEPSPLSSRSRAVELGSLIQGTPGTVGSPRHILAGIAAVAASYRLGALARDTGA